ncbi:MAG TPA: GNAT family N-acetyltransferase [Candidatus Merdivicinus excrementipullorum]|uniref:GNAT family N-acetyltransferase n=1 Tax=Candidatus Merdivicinus excrementipullorum TaxID=2840867 RepID=A0A9D1FL88_9FIRM|nr:GNAT family N-acetyltransferase [Candidatus Merdivicinus excrementipullorum]
MIRIKAVDAENLLDVCQLTTNQDSIGGAAAGHFYCNAVSIAEAKYYPEMHPNAIYHNNLLIGFFMYQRLENQAETATIRRFMIDDRFQQKGLEEKAFEQILRGLKIQGVKKVVLVIDPANESAKKLCLSFRLHLSGEIHQAECRYELEL